MDQQDTMEDGEDCSSFSSVTTMTETPSQQSGEGTTSINTDDETNNDTNIGNQDQDCVENSGDSLLQQFDQLEKLIVERNNSPETIIRYCKEIKKSYQLQQQNQNNNNNNDSQLLGLDSNVDKLKRLALRYAEVMSTVDQKSRSLGTLKNANHELNQYITSMENYHTKEMATLKAKISLTRIENEVRSSSSAEVTSSKSSVKVKKRRSSLLRFFTSSSKAGSSSSLNTSASSLDAEHLNSVAEKSKLKEDLLKKSIKIEELQKQCQDYDQRCKILESAVHNKNIELSVKINQLAKLNDDIKSHVSARAHFVEILNELEDTVSSLNKKLHHTQNEMRQNRDKTKENQKKVQRMEWILNKTDEENKLLLARLNTKNYEMSCKKVEHEQLFGEVKRFLLSVISLTQQDENSSNHDQSSNNEMLLTKDGSGDENDQEKILKRLMKISEKKLYKLCKDKSLLASTTTDAAVGKERISTTPQHVDRSSQTSVIVDNVPAPISENNNNNNNKHQENNYSHHQQISEMRNPYGAGGGFHNAGRHRNIPPFLPMNFEEKLFPNKHKQQQQQQQQHQQQTSHCQYQKAFDGYNNLFTNEFLGYVEYIKNKEISSYKDDLKSLEKENYLLKNSLSQSSQKVRKLQVEMNYTKSKQQPPRSPFSLPSLPSMSSPLNDHHTNHHREMGYVGPLTPGTSPAVLTSTSQPQITNNVFPMLSPTGFIPNDIRLIPDVPDDDQIGMNQVQEPGSDHEMFYQSFEKSNELIQGIFQERDALEQQLQLSRQQRRKSTTKN